jgi:hypothetical protein
MEITCPIKGREFAEQLSNYWHLKKDYAPWSEYIIFQNVFCTKVWNVYTFVRQPEILLL